VFYISNTAMQGLIQPASWPALESTDLSSYVHSEQNIIWKLPVTFMILTTKFQLPLKCTITTIIQMHITSNEDQKNHKKLKISWNY